MERLIAWVFLLIASPTAMASDMGAIVPLMLFQLGFFAWPFALPLFYLRPQKRKCRSYLLFVVFIFGVSGLVGFPRAILTSFSIWSPDDLYRSAVLFGIATNVVSLLICLWYLPRFGRLLVADNEKANP